LAPPYIIRARQSIKLALARHCVSPAAVKGIKLSFRPRRQISPFSGELIESQILIDTSQTLSDDVIDTRVIQTCSLSLSLSLSLWVVILRASLLDPPSPLRIARTP